MTVLRDESLIRLHLADFVHPPGHPLAGQQGMVNAFAVRHAAGVALIDTGVGWGRERMDAIYGPGRRPLESALAEHGIEVGDVTLVINTHLHFDHCGGNRLFPEVPIYVQANEYEAAQQARFTVAEWFDFPGACYVQITGDVEISNGVWILSTPGHTPGHQSVLLDANNGPVLVAGQAIYSAAEYEYIRQMHELPLQERTNDSGTYLASARRLIELNARRVLFSHDTAAWESGR